MRQEEGGVPAEPGRSPSSEQELGWGVPAVRTVVGLEGSKKYFNWLLPCTPLPEALIGPETESQRASLFADVAIEVISWLTKKKRTAQMGEDSQHPDLLFLLHGMSSPCIFS